MGDNLLFIWSILVNFSIFDGLKQHANFINGDGTRRSFSFSFIFGDFSPEWPFFSMSSAANYKAECLNCRTFKCVVLSRNGARFTSLKGNSKQSCPFTKKHMEIVPFCIKWLMVLAFFFIVLTLFILLSRSQNKACVTLDQYFILALKNIAVWSNQEVINFIGNHFEV